MASQEGAFQTYARHLRLPGLTGTPTRDEPVACVLKKRGSLLVVTPPPDHSFEYPETIGMKNIN